MKSSDRGGKGLRHSKCLIVDGYNILGRMKEGPLRNIPDLETMRQRLIDMLAEYQSFSAEAVIIVFDAHQIATPESDLTVSGVRVIYTAHHETADDRIERLVYELRDYMHQITVATSDYAEQQVIFGGGALRISANGLLARLREAKRGIRKNIAEAEYTGKTTLSDRIGQDVANILEKWRRKQ